jgi:hypothetical protein
MKKLILGIVHVLHFFGVASVIFAGVLLIRFMATNPVDAGPRSLFVTFVLLYGLCLSVVLALRMNGKNPLHFAKNAWIYASSAVIAAAPVMIAALGSLGQLSVWDVVLIIIIESGLYFYIRYQFRT